MEEQEKTPARRVPLRLEIEYRRSYARSASLGQLKNISLTGAFWADPDHELKQLDKVAIEFKVGGRARKIMAEIIWSNDNGCGLHFLPTNNRDVQIVDDLMYFVESKRESRRDVLDSIFKQVA